MCGKCTKEVHVSFLGLNFAHLDTFDVCKNARQFGACEVPLTIIGIPSVKRVFCIFHVQKHMLLLTFAERSGVNAALGEFKLVYCGLVAVLKYVQFSYVLPTYLAGVPLFLSVPIFAMFSESAPKMRHAGLLMCFHKI